MPKAGLEHDSNTDVGSNVSRVVPSPTAPYEFAPQQSRVPLTVTTHVFLSPHANASDFEDSVIFCGEETADSARDLKKEAV